MDIDYSNKTQLHQRSYPKFAKFEDPIDLGGNKAHHIFNDENEYFRDLSKSWFGLTCIKGGWDSLRHYEILSAGTLLLFRDYENKPCFVLHKITLLCYSNIDELDYLMSNLVVKNKPTTQYLK